MAGSLFYDLLYMSFFWF